MESASEQLPERLVSRAPGLTVVACGLAGAVVYGASVIVEGIIDNDMEVGLVPFWLWVVVGAILGGLLGLLTGGSVLAATALSSRLRSLAATVPLCLAAAVLVRLTYWAIAGGDIYVALTHGVLMGVLSGAVIAVIQRRGGRAAQPEPPADTAVPTEEPHL